MRIFRPLLAVFCVLCASAAAGDEPILTIESHIQPAAPQVVTATPVSSSPAVSGEVKRKNGPAPAPSSRAHKTPSDGLYRAGGGCAGCFGPNGALSGKPGRTFTFPDRLTGSPVAYRGVLYLSCGQTLCAFDPKRENLLWAVQLKSRPTVPALAGGRMFFRTEDGNLVALKAETGAVLWQLNAKGMTFSSPVTAFENAFFAVSSSGTLLCLDGASGKVKWQTETGLNNPTALLFADEILLVGGQNLGYQAYHPVYGYRRWQGGDGTSMDVSPSWSDGTAYFPDTRGRVRALRAQNARFLWTSEPFSPLAAPLVVSGERGWGVTADGAVFAVGLTEGKVIWRTQLPGRVLTALAVSSDGHGVYTVTEKGALYALDGNTGMVQWDIPFGEPPAADPVLSGGALWVCCGNKLSEVR